MNYKLVIIAALIVLGIMTEVSAAESRPRVVARLSDAGEVVLGKPFLLRIQVTHDVGGEVLWPDPLALGPALEERSRSISPAQPRGAKAMSGAEFTLLLFDTVTEVPRITLSYRSPLGVNENLVVGPIALFPKHMVDRTHPVLRPLQAPVAAMVRDWHSLFSLGAALAAALLVLFALSLVRRGRRAAPGEATALRPSAYDEAMATLAKLEASARMDARDLKPVFQELSEILRAYLGRRFDFPALDQTSSELCARLRRVSGAETLDKAVAGWLSRCDLVKYAGAKVTALDARSTLEGARVLIDRTKEEAMAQERPREVARG